MNNFLSSKQVKYCSLVLFGLFTFYMLVSTPPFWDEAHSWMISKSFSLFGLFEIEKYDGHLFIWHLIQSPFSKNDFLYPLTPRILNWLFCMGALIIFWNKGPFSTLQKALITFSFPFAIYFGVIGRCYSIGIFFLFYILSIWEERLNKPVFISFLIAVLANTSVMASIGALGLGGIFIFDLIKRKKPYIKPLSVLALGALIAFLQLNGANLPAHAQYQGVFKERLVEFFLLYDGFDPLAILNKIFALSVLALFFAALIYLRKNKASLVFMLLAFGLMISVFVFKYPGSFWHYLFFFIYLISSLWLFPYKKSKNFDIIFHIFLLILVLKTFLFPLEHLDIVYEGKAYEIQKIIKENNLFKKEDKIYLLDAFTETSAGILPYFKDTKFYDLWGNIKYSKEGFKNYNYEFIITGSKENTDILAESLDKNKRNLALTDKLNAKTLKGVKYEIILKKIFSSSYPSFIVYEMKPVKKD